MDKKLKLIFVLLVFPILLFSQNSSISNIDARTLYNLYNLNLDSVKNQYLYFHVYDWLGVKYKYAGNSKKGIDCSHFVTEVYAQVYCKQLAGGSADIWKTVKTFNGQGYEEGDLLFFKIRKNRISHVGIYLGNNQFIHASVKKGVIISNLTEDYYKRHYSGYGKID